jgi:hypothetical protein
MADALPLATIQALSVPALTGALWVRWPPEPPHHRALVPTVGDVWHYRVYREGQWRPWEPCRVWDDALQLLFAARLTLTPSDDSGQRYDVWGVPSATIKQVNIPMSHLCRAIAELAMMVEPTVSVTRGKDEGDTYSSATFE